MQIRIPADLHAWLRTYAFTNNLTMTSVITTYLDRLRDRKEAPLKVPEV